MGAIYICINITWGICENADSDSGGPGSGLRLCISSRFRGVRAAGWWNPLGSKPPACVALAPPLLLSLPTRADAWGAKGPSACSWQSHHPHQAAWAAGLSFSERSALQMLRTVPSQPEKGKRLAPTLWWISVCIGTSRQPSTPKLQASLLAAWPAGVLEMWAEMTPLPPLGAQSRWQTLRAPSQGSVRWDYSETILHHKSRIICGGAENLLPSCGFLMPFWNFL